MSNLPRKNRLPQLLIRAPLHRKFDEVELYYYLVALGGFKNLLFSHPDYIVRFASASACQRAAEELKHKLPSVVLDLEGNQEPDEQYELTPDLVAEPTDAIFIPRRSMLGAEIISRIFQALSGFKQMDEVACGHVVRFNDRGFALSAASELAKGANLGLYHYREYAEEDVETPLVLGLSNTGHNLAQIIKFLYSFPHMIRVVMAQRPGVDEVTFAALFSNMKAAVAAKRYIEWETPLKPRELRYHVVRRWILERPKGTFAETATLHIAFPTPLPDASIKFLPQWIEVYKNLIPGLTKVRQGNVACCTVRFTNAACATEALNHIMKTTNLAATFCSNGMECPDWCANMACQNVRVMLGEEKASSLTASVNGALSPTESDKVNVLPSPTDANISNGFNERFRGDPRLLFTGKIQMGQLSERPTPATKDQLHAQKESGSTISTANAIRQDKPVQVAVAGPSAVDNSARQPPITAAEGPLVECSACERPLPSSAYSQRQRKVCEELRRCIECMNEEYPDGAAVKHPGPSANHMADALQQSRKVPASQVMDNKKQQHGTSGAQMGFPPKIVSKSVAPLGNSTTGGDQRGQTFSLVETPTPLAGQTNQKVDMPSLGPRAQISPFSGPPTAKPQNDGQKTSIRIRTNATVKGTDLEELLKTFKGFIRVTKDSSTSEDCVYVAHFETSENSTSVSQTLMTLATFHRSGTLKLAAPGAVSAELYDKLNEKPRPLIDARRGKASDTMAVSAEGDRWNSAADLYHGPDMVQRNARPVRNVTFDAGAY